jgi:AAA+ ATPase superfamily predicted ATPase
VSQDGRIYAVSKTLILKKRGIEIKRDHGTAYNSAWRKTSGKRFWIRKTCSNRYGEFVAKETLDIVNTVLAMEPQWLMSTWILTEKLSKITAHGKSIRK